MLNLSEVPVAFDEEVQKLVRESKILVVGAGGIGCEILKNLALSGFNDIEIIDLDTIDVSNLNRQFLFRKEHVGKSKAMVARDSILAYNADINIKAYHDSITTSEYGVNFFKRFHLVLNALDNRAARNHVNRMCLAADIPLLESGTQGYLGQVELIKKGLTKCYECSEKTTQKTFPGCTIRNTPSEPVHCIVWAKHLFNQLFGEDDPDQDVSPDTADPEAAGEAGADALKAAQTDTGNIIRKSTKQWAQEINYNPAKLFNKFFDDDIKYLLSMANLWKTRKPPTPLTWAQIASHEGDASSSSSSSTTSSTAGAALSDSMTVWPLSRCARAFADSVAMLRTHAQSKEVLVWDKDYAEALDFVTACCNVRAYVFSIEQKSRFDIKSIAGNIIPAIATTNAITAGLVVLVAFRALAALYTECNTIYVRRKSSASKNVLLREGVIFPPNPKCYVCAPQPFINIELDVETMLVREFQNLVLKGSLNMIAPDVILDGKGVLVISSEEGETEMNDEKKLSELGIVDGSILKADDFLQNFELTICINQKAVDPKADAIFKILTDTSDIKAKPEENKAANGNSAKNGDEHGECSTSGMQQDGGNESDDVEITSEGSEEGPSAKRRKVDDDDSDDDLVMLDD